MTKFTDLIKNNVGDMPGAFDIPIERWEEIGHKVSAAAARLITQHLEEASLFKLLELAENTFDLRPRNESETFAIAYTIGRMWPQIEKDGMKMVVLKQLGVSLSDDRPEGESAPDISIQR